MIPSSGPLISLTSTAGIKGKGDDVILGETGTGLGVNVWAGLGRICEEMVWA